MFLAVLSAAVLSSLQPQPGGLIDQATRPLWLVGQSDTTVAAVDVPPPSEAPTAPVEVNLWVLVPPEGGVDTIAAALTVDCARRSFVHHSFTGYSGANFVRATAASDTSDYTADPDTVYGRMVAMVCDPSGSEPRPADASDFRALAQFRSPGG